MTVIGHRERLDSQRKENPKQVQRRPLARSLRTLVRIILSTPRVFLSGCGKARFAGNSGAIAKKRNAAAAAREQPNVKIILTRVLKSMLEIALMSDLNRLRELMRRLRAPQGGCPWDLEQTFNSLVPHTIEEVYEVADVIASGELRELPAELGDLLFQILFYSQLGEEQGRFSLDDVMAALAHKLVTRHPHVFGDAQVTHASAVTEAWEARKSRERRARHADVMISELDDVPLALPALSRARKLQKRAARVGFDWPDVSGPWAKLREESLELQDAAAQGDRAAVEGELGDLLFAVVNLARHLDTDPEAALRAANQKFERRFRHIEAVLASRGERMESANLATLDALWDEAKRVGK